MSYGSAFGQDHWVIHEVFAGKRGGYFVEAGALNGVDESNTVLLERDYGWTGICVEPHSAYFRTLQQQRKCLCENVCLYDSETEVEFLEIGGHGGIPRHFSADYGQKGKPVTKKAMPLASILDKNRAPSVIDYLSLDTEGTEYVILKDFPFDRYRFLAITIEHNHHPELRAQLTRLLTEHDYVLCRSVLVDDWWVHRSHYERIDADRRRYWELQNRFPLPESALRHREISQKYQELLSTTRSLSGAASLFFRQLRKKLRNSP